MQRVVGQYSRNTVWSAEKGELTRMSDAWPYGDGIRVGPGAERKGQRHSLSVWVGCSHSGGGGHPFLWKPWAEPTLRSPA